MSNKPSTLTVVSTGCPFRGSDHLKDIHMFPTDPQNLHLLLAAYLPHRPCLSFPNRGSSAIPHRPPHHTTLRKDQNGDTPTTSLALGYTQLPIPTLPFHRGVRTGCGTQVAGQQSPGALHHPTMPPMTPYHLSATHKIAFPACLQHEASDSK